MTRVACKHGHYPWEDGGHCTQCSFEQDQIERRRAARRAEEEEWMRAATGEDGWTFDPTRARCAFCCGWSKPGRSMCVCREPRTIV